MAPTEKEFHESDTSQIMSINLEHDEKPHNLAHGLVKAAHLYQEDSNGSVIGRILIPRPTNDPMDPLAWSLARKHLAFASCSFFVFLSNYVSASIIPILFPLAEEFQVDANKVTYLATFNILFLGIGNLFWIPLSIKIGKRPVFIMSCAIFFAACIWGAEAHSWGSMLGARIVQGFGASSAEALGPAVVADVYFLHERGTKVGFYVLMITGGGAFGGIFSGLITNANPAWQWVFWMDSILTGTCLLLIILFLTETNFQRPVEFENGGDSDSPQPPMTIVEHHVKPSLIQSLNVLGGYQRKPSFARNLWRPFATLRYPAVVWGSVICGFTLGWGILIQAAIGVFFPVLYNFNGYNVGNVNYASLVGAIIGCTAGGLGSDFLVNNITKRRNGYFKPEYRLWTLIPIFIVSPMGLFIWAGGVQSHLPPMVPIVGWAITYAALCAVPAVAFTYVVDCYKPLAGETTTILVAFKNSFAFGISFAVVPWILKDGFVKVTGFNLLIGGMAFLAAIPMYVYGERLRQWTSKLDV